jgi:hypothetical protein
MWISCVIYTLKSKKISNSQWIYDNKEENASTHEFRRREKVENAKT